MTLPFIQCKLCFSLSYYFKYLQQFTIKRIQPITPIKVYIYAYNKTNKDNTEMYFPACLTGDAFKFVAFTTNKFEHKPKEKLLSPKTGKRTSIISIIIKNKGVYSRNINSSMESYILSKQILSLDIHINTCNLRSS